MPFAITSNAEKNYLNKYYFTDLFTYHKLGENI